MNFKIHIKTFFIFLFIIPIILMLTNKTIEVMFAYTFLYILIGMILIIYDDKR